MEALDTFICKVADAIVNPLITLLAIAAFVVFVWGIVQFIAGAGDEEKRRTGQRTILWGLLGLVIIFGAQAIIAILAATVDIPLPGKC